MRSKPSSLDAIDPVLFHSRESACLAMICPTPQLDFLKQSEKKINLLRATILTLEIKSTIFDLILVGSWVLPKPGSAVCAARPQPTIVQEIDISSALFR